DTGLAPTSYDRIKNTITALSGAFSAFDEVGVYRFDTYVKKLSDFTDSQDALVATLGRLKDIQPVYTADSLGFNPFSPQSPLINGRPVAPSLELPPIVRPQKEVKVLHDAIFAVAGDLAKRPPERRRVLLVVSDGRTGGNEHTYDQALARLLENNI